MIEVDLSKILEDLPSGATEAVVTAKFIPPLLQALGFNTMEQYPQFNTGGNDCVDYAARKNTPDSDIFIHSKQNPYLLVEVKGQAISGGTLINLSEGTPKYLETRKQLMRYLLSAKCDPAEWGIITNSIHIQLFRKHGKVIVPATACTYIKPDNVNDVVANIRQLIESPPKALTVCIYNNKGGVGKTTTTVNLAAIFARLGKRVLVVDFDPQQQDLTRGLGIQPGLVRLHDCLTDRGKDVCKVVQPFTVRPRNSEPITFDVIPGDPELAADSFRSKVEVQTQGGATRLREVLKKFVYDYDYILIDSPPNWTFFSKSGVWASDVVLIPAKHNSFYSLENAAITLKDFIAEIKKQRGDGGPVGLPIFFNGEQITDAQKRTAFAEMGQIITREKKSSNFDLTPYFFSKWTKAHQDFHVFALPNYAHVANAAFSRLPAAYKDQKAARYYHSLAKEYFIR